MTTLSLAEVRANLSKLVESAVTTHERIEVTRNGDRVAVLLGADDYDSLLETLDILSNPDEVAAIRAGLAVLEAGEVFTADEVRARPGRPRELAGCPARTRWSSPDRPAVPSSTISPSRSQLQPSSSSWDRQDPRRFGKPLREPLAPLFAARRGEYRVIYRIVDQRLVIEVVSAFHRRDAYNSSGPPRS